jgi:small ligand-binding sensory domain FIST
MKARIGGATPKMVLNFDCAGRGKFLIGSEMAKREVGSAQEILGKSVPWLGWYTYGEIAPVGKRNYFHNWTSVLCSFY